MRGDAVTIQFACPTCKKNLKAPVEKPGAKVKCPACKTIFQVASRVAPGVPALPQTSPLETGLNLAAFAIRPLVGYACTALGIPGKDILAKGVAHIASFVADKFKDDSQRLSKALHNANEKAWETLEYALEGESLWKRVTARGEDSNLAQLMREFLDSVAASQEFEGEPAFRQRCLDELRKARKKGILTGTNKEHSPLAQLSGIFARYADPVALLNAEWEFVAQLANALEKQECESLATLLRQRPPQAESLLVVGVRYYFRRSVEEDTKLFQGLVFAKQEALGEAQDKWFAKLEEDLGIQKKGIAKLGEAQKKGFNALFTAFATQGQRLEGLLVDISEDMGEMKKSILNIQDEMERLGDKVADAVLRRMEEDVLKRLSQAGMQKGEAKPEHSYSIRSPEEREAVKRLLVQFRQLSPGQQKQLPALLNGLGKLQQGIGDLEGARESFVAVAENISDKSAKAEAYFNAYRVALDKKNWDEALESIQQAAKLAPERYALFPQRYQPRRILGAGGFGAAFLCYDPNLAEEVVVKAIHATDTERSMDSVFQEARTLRKLGHEAIIRVIDCGYADTTNQARPYLIMDFFPGGSLETFVRERGTLTPEHLVVVAREIAAGMRAAHQQNILHRDLKPDNVLVNKQGDSWKVKIIDFGLAMQRQAIEASTAKAAAGDTPFINSAVGTVKYAPPEQMGEGGEVGPWSDVYSFGKLCCYALFKTTEPKRRQWSEIPEELAEMLERCTEHELKHRLPDFEPILNVLNELDPANRRNEHSTQEEEARQQERKQREKEEAERQNKIERNREQEEAERKRQEQEEGRLLQEVTSSQQEEEAVDFNLDDLEDLTDGPRSEARLQQEEEAVDFEALDDLDEPSDPTGYAKRAEERLGNNEFDLAIADCTEAIRLDPRNVPAYATRAEAFRLKSEFDLAIADGAKAIRLDPKNVRALYARGESYRMKGDLDCAIADCTEAIRLGLKDVRAWYTRSEAYRMKGDLDGAIADATKAIRLDHEYFLAYATRGAAYRQKKDFPAAISDLTECLRLSPNYEWASEQLTMTHHAAEEQQKAETEQQQRERTEETERQRRQAPRGFWRRMGGAIFGLTFVGPILGAMVGQCVSTIDDVIRNNFGSLSIPFVGVMPVFPELELMLTGGAIVGGALFVLYGVFQGWYSNADSDRTMRFRNAVLGAVIPGPFLGAVVGAVLRPLAWMIAWFFSYDVGSWEDWMKWGAIFNAGVFGLIGWGGGWTDWKGRNWWIRLSNSLLFLVAFGVIGGIVGLVLRVIPWLPSLFFGWEIGSWFTWMMWGAIVGGVFGALGGWADGVIGDSSPKSVQPPTSVDQENRNFSFSCTNCGAILKTRNDVAGKKVKCPKCQEVFVVASDG